MDIKGETVKQYRIINKFALLVSIIIITLNINTFKVNAKANTNLNIDLNNKIYSLSNKGSDNLLDNLMVALTGKINGYEVVLNENVVGYTVLENNLENIKSEVLKKYISENSIREDMVKSFDIKWDINLREERFDVEMLQTNKEVVDNIYNIAEKDPEKIRISVNYIK